LLNDLAEQIKKVKALTVFCCHPNNTKKCSDEITKILPKVFVQQALRIIDSKKITDINEHFPQTSVSTKNLQVLMCTKYEKYSSNFTLGSI